MAETKAETAEDLPGLTAAEFQHPHDATATEALASVPGLDLVVTKVLEYGLERLYYLENIADNVRVTPRMLPRLHRYTGVGLPDPRCRGARALRHPGPRPQRLHVRPQEAVHRADLRVGAVAGDEELLFTLGHELGHIKAGHVLYTMLARNIATIVAAIGQATLGNGSLLGQGLVVALHDWYRKAELTSDRAGLLCVQEPNRA